MPDIFVTIEIHPAIAQGMSEEFSATLRAVLNKKRQVFNYKDTTFQVEYRGSQPKGIKVTLNSLDAPLPAVFQNELTVNFVGLRASIPSKVRAQTGWYVGDNFGFPDAGCCIDPEGEHPKHMGLPTIYAAGDKFASVVGLYKLVMTGKLTPGYKGDKWSDRVYR
jgi:hypothetical protein